MQIEAIVRNENKIAKNEKIMKATPAKFVL